MAEGKAFEELINMTTVISGIGENSINKSLEFLKTILMEIIILLIILKLLKRQN